jgi:metallo-beta-lactamase class B
LYPIARTCVELLKTTRRTGLNLTILASLLCGLMSAQAARLPCRQCATWNIPQVPFRIYGNTYYVGPHGLSSILVTSSAGHVLIDGALPESVPQIVANIRTLGFRIEDVKLIVNSHAHFDHAGGIAELQRLSGARVVVSAWTSEVMTKTGVARNDPQYGVVSPIALVAHVETLSDNETFNVGQVAVTAHLTPGHTPGGTSWTWKSCEAGNCLDMVYADSLSPVSADGFKFTGSREYPNAIQDFKKSFSFLRTTPCDILLTPHPEASSLWDRVEARRSPPKPDPAKSDPPTSDPMVDSSACRHLADMFEDKLRERLAEEAAH